MKIPIRVRVRRNDKLVVENGILWIDELPPELRRGKNRKMKNRKYKREQMKRQLEERDARSPSNRVRLPGDGRRDLDVLARRRQ